MRSRERYRLSTWRTCRIHGLDEIGLPGQ